MPTIGGASSQFSDPFDSGLDDEKYSTYASSEIPETTVHATLQQRRCEIDERPIPQDLQKRTKEHGLSGTETAEHEALGKSVDRHSIGNADSSHESVEDQGRRSILSDFESRPTVSLGSLESRPPSPVPVSDSSGDEKGITPTQKVYKRVLKEVANSNRRKGKILPDTRARLSIHAEARRLSKSGVVSSLISKGLKGEKTTAVSVDQIRKTHVEKMEEKRKANAQRKDRDDEI